MHVVYFLVLIRGYALGDLSVVYPLARGTGPLLATAAAIAVFGERPSLLALAGTASIAVGIVLLLGNPLALRSSGSGAAIFFALLTGVLIAAYTLWDKQAVSTARIPVALYYWSSLALQTLLLTPVALVGPPRHLLGKTLRASWRAALGVAVLSPLSYFLVLTAFTMAPVSYVAPSREIGILLGAVMGSHFLDEGHLGRRLVAAAMMVLGVAALALG